jgi:hypothetical protein
MGFLLISETHPPGIESPVGVKDVTDKVSVIGIAQMRELKVEIAAQCCNLEVGLTKPFGLVRVKVPP